MLATLTRVTVLLSFCCSLYGQQSVPYYEQPGDVFTDTPGPSELSMFARYRDSSVIEVKRFVDERTGAKPRDKFIRYPWAIRVDSAYFFNLRYVTEYQNTEVFARGEVIGDIAVITIDKNSNRRIKGGGNSYGGGLSGVVMNSSQKWGKGWRGPADLPTKVLVIDLQPEEEDQTGTFRDRVWKLLSRQDVNAFFGTDFAKETLQEWSVEDLLKYLESMAETR